MKNTEKQIQDSGFLRKAEDGGEEAPAAAPFNAKIKDSRDKNVSEISSVQAEETRLLKLLKNKGIDPDKLKIAADLVKDTAYMTVKTALLKKEIDENGITEVYQNGENQYGKKKSAAFDAYLNMTKQKSALIKQLTDLLPSERTVETSDEFDEFTKFRKRKNRPDNALL